MSDIRLMLERVAEEGGRTTVTSEAVHAGARKLRRKRRALISGALAAVVLAGVVAVPVLDQFRDGADRTNAAAKGKPKTKDAQSRRLAQLLPEGFELIERVGSIKQALVHEGRFPVKHFGTWGLGENVGDPGLGPLDGEYSVVRAGQEGGISITVLSANYVDMATSGGLGTRFCTSEVPGSIGECVTTELYDGRTLVTWRVPDDEGTSHIIGYLTLKNGDVLVVDAQSTLRPKSADSRPDYPPLDREELTGLMANRHELLPKG
ncbi:hypothetical protein ACIBCM_11790 [Streptomyces sp. NPDC051018]|uniref:hypothetical protein n=1 Tax=Streptomyces sp. NPDC051018 TaxID=3365639 RepID=UPI0037A003EA